MFGTMVLAEGQEGSQEGLLGDAEEPEEPEVETPSRRLTAHLASLLVFLAIFALATRMAPRTLPSRQAGFLLLDESLQDVCVVPICPNSCNERIVSYHESTGAYSWGGTAGNRHTADLLPNAAGQGSFRGWNFGAIQAEHWMGTQEGGYRLLNSEGAAEEYAPLGSTGGTPFKAVSPKGTLTGGPFDGQPLNNSALFGPGTGSTWYIGEVGHLVQYVKPTEEFALTVGWGHFSGGGDLDGKPVTHGVGLLDFTGRTAISNEDWILNINKKTGTIEYYSALSGAWMTLDPFSSWTTLTGGEMDGLTLLELAAKPAGHTNGNGYRFLGSSNQELLFAICPGPQPPTTLVSYAASSGDYSWGGASGNPGTAFLLGSGGEFSGSGLSSIKASQWLGLEGGGFHIINAQGFIEHYYGFGPDGGTPYYGKSEQNSLSGGPLDRKPVKAASFFGACNGELWYAGQDGGLLMYTGPMQGFAFQTPWKTFSGGGGLAGQSPHPGVGLRDFAGHTTIAMGDLILNVDKATGALEYYSAVNGARSDKAPFGSWTHLKGKDLDGLSLVELAAKPAGRIGGIAYRFLGISNNEFLFVVSGHLPETSTASTTALTETTAASTEPTSATTTTTAFCVDTMIPMGRHTVCRLSLQDSTVNGKGTVTALTLPEEECREVCLNDPECTGIEVSPSDNRCEIWNKPICKTPIQTEIWPNDFQCHIKTSCCSHQEN